MSICKDCKYYYELNIGSDYDFQGLCHRYPPDRIPLDKALGLWRWTRVYEDDWCGEWRDKVHPNVRFINSMAKAAEKREDEREV
jgi:hypothetical protein